MKIPDKKIIEIPTGRHALSLAETACAADGPLIVIVNDLKDKSGLLDELDFFNKNPALPVYDFPDWETLPYDAFSPHIDIISERLRILALLPKLQQGIILIGARSISAPLPPSQFIKTHTFQIKIEDKLDLQGERHDLIAAGYQQVDTVFARGEYSIRGSIFDIFPMGSNMPYRIDLFDNGVESIRDFDIETQRSKQKYTAIELLPAHEFPFDSNSISNFILRYESQFGKLSRAFNALKQGIPVQGLEYYLPLFFERCATVFDYCPTNSTIVIDQQLESTWQHIESETLARYEEKRYDLDRPPLPPRDLFWRHDFLFSQLKKFRRLEFHSIATAADCATTKTLYCAETAGRQQLLIEHLSRQNIQAAALPDWPTVLTAPPGIYISIARLIKGWSDTQLNLKLIPESDLFQNATGMHIKKRNAEKAPNFKGFEDLSELNLNDIVVHIQHGIGRYLGLSTLELTGQNPQEFLTLEYAKEDKLYVPVYDLHLISRYSIGDLKNIPLHQLGSDRWAKLKDKAAKRITDIAAELLELYAKRMGMPGFACQPPNSDYHEFVLAFPFDETDDQAKAIQDVIDDMTSQHPMDRLLCGDVGFGKTEVAMRAAFLAVQSGKQVAILVPTTLLAEQHFENFQNRFARWPITIGHFSRITSRQDEKDILLKTASGQLDILIGTHKLIRGELSFKDLGLIVVDEEHRFGVKDKEKLRSFKTHVDTLTMTATPIPRTLNFSLSMLRDLSIIATPPAKRLSIKTFVKEQKDSLIKEAILREVLRGGQVYYLHNDVASIESRRQKLATMLPNLRILIGHGQMRPRDLERVMADFYHNRAQVLVCSTIIETGIDIPNANTIIIENADRFGLAQLHQLRGRVGRSYHQAYAYLLIPAVENLTRDATKRLEAIERSTELGSGFTLASHDLEIRGAGEVLGQGQSGHMEEIGFSLYNEMLQRAIQSFKSGQAVDYKTLLIAEGREEVELNIPRLFPATYIEEVNVRLKLYQRLQKIQALDTLLDFQLEIIDRFGALPEPALNLFECQRLKLEAKALGILRIEGHATQIKFTLSDKLRFDPLKLIRLVQVHARELQLRGETEIVLKREMKNSLARIEAAGWILQNLNS